MSLLGRLAEEHAASPASARLKAALLFAGVRYDPCLPEAVDWAFPAYWPHHLLPGEEPFRGQHRVEVPYLALFEDQEFHDLVQVRLRIKRDSPFVIRKTGEPRRYTLFDGDKPITGVTFEPKLPWADDLTADGTPLKATGMSQHGDMLVFNAAPGCEYFVIPKEDGSSRTENLSCTFCLYGVPDQRLKSLGQTLYEPRLPPETIDRVAEACSHPETHARHLYLVGGSMLSMQAEGERYVQIARRLAESGLHERYYIACGSGALERPQMEQLVDAGVRGACFNLEVWGPSQFARICPGKAKVVGYERWLDSCEEAVSVFGDKNVYTAFVCGIELDGDGAYTDPQQALEANIEAAEWLIPKGVQPIFSLYWKVAGKNRGEEPLYSLDNFLKLNEVLASIRRREARPINSDFLCRRCAYMQLEPDYDVAVGS